jgi:uncharacterized protein (TIGR02466 family)
MLKMTHSVDLSYEPSCFFPVIIHSFLVKEYDRVKDDLIKYSYELKKNDSEGKNVSNVGGWQSKSSKLSDENPTLNNIILSSIRTLPLVENLSVDIAGWTNINIPGSFNTSHNHPNCHLSGVFWIKIPDNSGDIVFDDPNNFNKFVEFQSYDEDFKNHFGCSRGIKHSPKEGQILIFPSYLEHMVDRNNSFEDRISYAFNIHINL